MIARLEGIIARAADSYRPDARFLAVLRMAYGLWILLFPVDILWIAAVPNEFVHPRPGLFSFIHSVPPEGLLIALTIVRAVLAVLLAVGILTLPVSILMTAVMITAAGISYSFSKVDHFILFELVPLFLVFAGWGNRWSFDAWWRSRRSQPAPGTHGMPVLLYAMTIGWAMLSAAVPKVLGGWLDPSRQATRGYIARDIAINEKLGPLGQWLLPLDVDLFWKLLDYATIAAEGLLIVFVLTPTLFRCWLLLLACFHTGVYLTLGISFIDYTLVYAVFFSPVVMWIIHRIRRSPRAPAEVTARHA